MSFDPTFSLYQTYKIRFYCSIMFVSNVLVIMSGTNLSSGLFVREISMFFPESRSTRHYVFEEATSTILSVEDSRTNWYQTTVLGGLGVHQPTSGALPRFTIPTILDSLKRYRILCAGSVTKTCLETYLEDTEIIDFQRCRKLSSSRELYEGCGEDHHTARGCSLNRLHQLIADPLFKVELDIFYNF